MSLTKSIGIIFFIIIFGLIYSSIYVVNEGEQSLLLFLGKISTNADGQPLIGSPGLHIKWPILNEAKIFDARLQTLNVDSSRILTQEQKYVLVDYYAKWRISDLALYYKRTGGDADITRDLLQQKINDDLRAEFGKRTLDVIISDQRDSIMNALLTQTQLNAKSLGINVIDVRIRGIDLPAEISSSVYASMRAKRESVAIQYRADGKAAAEAMRANADATVTITIANANEQAARIRADGDAAASKIYADAYNKDPEFYAFYRGLSAFQNSFTSKNDILILKPDDPFFKYFTSDTTNKTR
jgi:membrane protease subunit HflC